MSGKTVPPLAAVAASHWEAAARGELSLPRCASCDTVFYPPSRFCPACLSEEICWHSVPSGGTVLSWCTFHKAYYKDFWLDLPYVVVLVRLDSGPQLYGNLVDNKKAPAVGMRVQAVFTPVNDTQALVQFQSDVAL